MAAAQKDRGEYSVGVMDRPTVGQLRVVMHYYEFV